MDFRLQLIENFDIDSTLLNRGLVLIFHILVDLECLFRLVDDVVFEALQRLLDVIDFTLCKWIAHLALRRILHAEFKHLADACELLLVCLIDGLVVLIVLLDSALELLKVQAKHHLVNIIGIQQRLDGTGSGLGLCLRPKIRDGPKP